MKKYKDKFGNWWTPEEREAGGLKIKMAEATGKLPPRVEVGCERCGQREGILHRHIEDYGDPLNSNEVLCWRCHMLHHVKWRAKAQVEKYEADLLEGIRFEPFHKPNFDLLNEQHEIGEKFGRAEETKVPGDDQQFELRNMVDEIDGSDYTPTRWEVGFMENMVARKNDYSEGQAVQIQKIYQKIR